MVQRAALAASHLQGPKMLTAQLDHLLSLVHHMLASQIAYTLWEPSDDPD